MLLYLLLSWLTLQDVLLPDGVEHAALPAEVSEALLFTLPVHLRHTRAHSFSGNVIWGILKTDLQHDHLGGQTQNEHGEALHDRGVLVKQ